ncbi:hypothetical protein BJ684DRAFT_21935 [Piptocephalis cylindrospora]|uniref:DNA-directed RNA polymerases I and III subunit RPAC2 n=1 Tax=Piptocephalis cylindrospora TaxID=1907219 RepID=A0A4P9XZD2_9FUNG|nr:hypothetical protein BJ684DRAFT_21935 [Piptocephalis cylindrospora]|eukprot:RKP11492.1 hypothetical protein BJ684DRAFT_21935 [Piptocephalis cylindrospora]
MSLQEPDKVVAVPELEGLKIEMLAAGGGRGMDPTAVTFCLFEEDHTLGNVLRWILMKNPEVEFCGYSVPDPFEAKVHLRVQTSEKTTAVEALHTGLDQLMEVCDTVKDKFQEEVKAERYEVYEEDP